MARRHLLFQKPRPRALLPLCNLSHPSAIWWLNRPDSTKVGRLASPHLPSTHSNTMSSERPSSPPPSDRAVASTNVVPDGDVSPICPLSFRGRVSPRQPNPSVLHWPPRKQPSESHMRKAPRSAAGTIVSRTAAVRPSNSPSPTSLVSRSASAVSSVQTKNKRSSRLNHGGASRRSRAWRRRGRRRRRPRATR